MSTPVVVEIIFLFLIVCGPTLMQVQDSLLMLSSVAIVGGHLLAPALLVTISFYYSNLYDLRIVHSFSEFARRLPLALGIALTLLYSFYAFVPQAMEENDPLLSCVLLTLAVFSVIVPARLVLYRLLHLRFFSRRVIILGTGPIAWKTIEAIETNPQVGYTIVGLVDDQREAVRSELRRAKYPYLGPIDRLHEILDEYRPDRIIVAVSERRGCLPVGELLHARLAGCIIDDAISVLEQLTGKLAIESVNPSFLFFSDDFTVSRRQLTARRFVSFVCALVGFVLTAPLMLLTAIAIKIDSSGPVFFVQERCGLHGRTFRLVKFRTMHPVRGESHNRTVWERDDSSRITRVGKWLRKLRLDEIPQFLNVLLGHMNMIGPRPEMASNVETMMEAIPYYALRMSVRPGITGWAQVRHGYSVSQEDVTEKTRYDLYYVKHMSLRLDLQILLDTVKIVLLGRNADERPSREKEGRNQSLTTSVIVEVLPSEKSIRHGWQ